MSAQSFVHGGTIDPATVAVFFKRFQNGHFKARMHIQSVIGGWLHLSVTMLAHDIKDRPASDEWASSQRLLENASQTLVDILRDCLVWVERGLLPEGGALF